MTCGMTAIIPAHNEEASIGATIRSIRANGVERIIAVLDNCTDNTGRVAMAEGARARPAEEGRVAQVTAKGGEGASEA